LVQLSDCSDFLVPNPETRIHTFWGRLETVRCAVPLLLPVSSVISRQEWRGERKWANFEASTIFLAGRAAFPTAGVGRAGLHALAESDSFLLRDRGENEIAASFKNPQECKYGSVKLR
jgi:hypothetical protein